MTCLWEQKLNHSGVIMEGEVEKQEGFKGKFSILLELSASDDLMGFIRAVEEEGYDIDEPSFWYGRRIGSKKLKFEERTPLMVASMFGSVKVSKYILETGLIDVNRVYGSDKVTALHCAAAGGAACSPEIVRLLLDHSADLNSVDANGNRPGDVIAPNLNLSSFSRKNMLEIMLNGSQISESFVDTEEKFQQISKDGPEKKEYPVDLSLPDIKNGIYGTDEFRMFTFKVKPCSRAYSHDWTECPFVHPGENARRRDPRKYHYSCVPCPEFRKGTCRQGDACEYAHGIFECWLHPAQYRTRLCKDETGCNRRVCFFAHKPEELRPLYASTGSGLPSPRSFSTSASPLDMAAISPLALGSPAVSTPPPMTPTSVSSAMAGALWASQLNAIPPALQLPGSRLKTTLTARDMDMEAELLGLENHRISSLSSPSSWAARYSGLTPTNLDDVFGSLDHPILTQIQSPTGMQMRQNMNQQLRSSYPTNLSSSPGRSSPLNSRSAAFAQRSQSFIDRNAVNRISGFSPSGMSSTLSDWGSPDGRLDWGIQGEELNKLRKSASFGFRSSGNTFGSPIPATVDEPDVSWVQTLVKDTPPTRNGRFSPDEEQQKQYYLSSGGSEVFPAWAEQMYMEQEQMVA